jgi:hypothetical protein
MPSAGVSSVLQASILAHNHPILQSKKSGGRKGRYNSSDFDFWLEDPL